MIYTVAGFKGGVGKTTTSVHLAAYLNTLAPTILFDGDQTRNATDWSKAGDGLPFPVAPENQAIKLARKYEHIVVDTGQQPTIEMLREAAGVVDLFIIPTKPGMLDTASLIQMLEAMREVGCTRMKVLLTMVAPFMAKKAASLRAGIESAGVEVFATEIPRLEIFDKAATAGCTVDLVKDEQAARAWAAYEAFGKELGL